MKLSEAIRIGSTKRPQCKTVFFQSDNNGMATHSCVLGAAYEAITGKTPLDLDDVQLLAFWDLNDPLLAHPIGTRALEGSSTIMEGLIELNDYAGWSRERIADWLESLGM